MKKFTIVSFIAFFVIAASTSVYSDSAYKKMRHKYNLEEKLFNKAHIIMKNKDELKLSDDQITKIKNLKLNTKKDIIRKKAEIDVIGLDIKSKLWDEVIDVKGINKLVDQKYDLKKEKTKSLIAAYAELKNILSKEQKEKLKEIIHCKDKMKMKYKK